MLYESLQRPQIHIVDLQLNGIAHQNMTTYFQWLFNYETLVELNLSSNWFGIDGLYEIRESFIKFRNLTTLKIA